MSDQNKNLEDVIRAAASLDRPVENRPAVMPGPYHPFTDALRRAGDFAATLSRKVTGHPKLKPKSSDDFRI